MLPIVGTAIRAWRDTFLALRRMPLMFGAAVAASCIVDIAMTVVPAGHKLSITATLRSFLGACLYSVILAPLVIAMHRYVLLDEDRGNYAFNFRDPRFSRFVWAELAYTTVLLTLLLLLSQLVKEPPAAVSIGLLFVTAAVLILALRLLILFPAIAVDAPGARWTNAWADSRGITWRLSATVILVALPTLPITLLYNAIPETHSLGRIASSLAGAIEQAFQIAAMAALASHFFRSAADRLIQPS